ncbi:MAG: hypothetical protein NTY74_03680 [Ignavibacteriae bacterium]|nr:hypothetical protein [Ignavibacteriota bacterium]
MSKHNRDVKFIIYQVLYIFVIVIITIKGADINLEEVLSADKVVEKDIANAWRRQLDSILALGLVPKIEIDENRTREDFLRNPNPPPINYTSNGVIGYTPPNETNTFTSNDKVVEKDKNEKDNGALTVGEQVIPATFKQYADNSYTNKTKATVKIIGDDGVTLATVAPGATANFRVMGQSTVRFDNGTSNPISLNTSVNTPPNVQLTSVNRGSGDAKLSDLQSTGGYTLTISDDTGLGNLDISFSNNVTVKPLSSGSYQIKLSQFGSKAQFDKWAENKSAPYSVSFTVTVKDKINPKHVVVRTGKYEFGEW